MKVQQRRRGNGGFQRRRRIDLGLAVMAATITPGTKLKQGEIAAFCDCTRQAIQDIEANAIKKLREAARKRGIHELLDLEEVAI